MKNTFKNLYKFFIGSVAVLAVLIIDQIWLEAIGTETSMKLIASIIIANLAVGISYLIWKEFSEEKKLKKSKHQN
jgi:hypothetical protein